MVIECCGKIQLISIFKSISIHVAIHIIFDDFLQFLNLSFYPWTSAIIRNPQFLQVDNRTDKFLSW